MRKNWKNLTPQAKVIYQAAFGEPLPRGWHVYSVPWMRSAAGLCKRAHKEILINRADHRGGVRRNGCPRKPMNILRTLIHEFIHVRCVGLRHGQEFERLIDAAMERVWQH